MPRMRQLRGSGEDRQYSGERQEDEESVRPGGHGGRQQQQAALGQQGADPELHQWWS